MVMLQPLTWVKSAYKISREPMSKLHFSAGYVICLYGGRGDSFIGIASQLIKLIWIVRWKGKEKKKQKFVNAIVL